MIKRSALLNLFLLGFGSVAAHAATIGAAAVTPASVQVGVSTAVKFTVVISDPSVIASSVNLQQVSTSGQSTVVGTMYDDGTHGDAIPGDNTYTLQISLFQQTPGTLTYRVSAGFQGSLTRPFSAPISLAITGAAVSISISSPAPSAYLSISPTLVTGTVGSSGATVTVNGIAAQVSGTSFSASVPLQEGSNPITAVAQNSSGPTTSASETVTLDTTPPHVTIAAPVNISITTDATISVSGIVNDIVVGTVNPIQATVTVNGISAQVTNRTYLATNVPLQIGSNTIASTARDRAGNFATTSVTVTRTSAPQSTLRIISGNNLSGPIKSLLVAPLVVQALNASGQPIVNTPVVFQVTGGDGTLTTGAPPGLASVAVNTNSQGQAQVNYILGTRAGSGNNMVQASGTGIATTPTFSESATTTAAAMIVVDSGSDQNGVVGQALPLPLIAVVTDSGYNRLANVPVSFTVAQGGGAINGQSAVTVTSDSDGRVQGFLTLGSQAGISNNIVTASFSGNPGLPASFTSTAYVPGAASDTKITGVVLDNSNNPIAGVSMRLYQLNSGSNSNIPQQVTPTVVTNARGFFSIQPAPVGVYKLMADGSTATSGGAFPTLEYDLTTVAGQNNTVGLPIYLPALNTASQLCVSTTVGGTLTIPQAPGFALKIAAGSATFPGGTRTGCVSVTPVNMDKIPMVPGFGQQPRFIVTIQPVGTVFNPPAQITIPNVDGLAPRSVTEMYSYDHDLASFVAIGTGSVSADGSVIASDPGVGVIKAGWHCGGNPDGSGSAASLAVTLTPAVSQAAAGASVNMTAAGTPPLDGIYTNWEVIDDPADPHDDPTVATFTTTPSCPNMASCVAQLKGNKIGIVSVRVTFKCTTTGATVTSSIVKVEFTLGLTPKEVSFFDNITIFKDKSGSAPQIMNPIWKSTNAATDNDSAGYIQKSTMRVSVKFGVNPVPSAPVTNVTIQGVIPGLGKFVKTGVTIPAAAEFTVTDILADTKLPASTKFYNPMTVNWQHMADGQSCPKCTMDGSTANQVYVTLATPTATTARGANEVFLSTLNFAASKDGATTPKDAFANSWSLISGPANIKTWDGRLLYYYKDGVGFSGCALDETDLLTTTNGSGQCGSFAYLLIGIAAANGIAADFVSIGTADGASFLVKDWTFTSTSYSKGTATETPGYPDYQWKLVFNAAGDPMVPKQPGDQYGDLKNLTTLKGQNSAPPSEKDFGSHYIVKVTVNPPMLYYDPSYGVTYAGADKTAASASFEANAVEGFYFRLAGDPAGQRRLRKPGGGVNITFDK